MIVAARLREVCPRRVLVLALSVLLGAASAGCTQWIPIQPTELPKLNGMYVRHMGTVHTQNANVHISEVTVATVQQPDGRMVQIGGAFNSKVRLKGGEEWVLMHPVVAELEDETMQLKSSNLAPMSVPLQDIVGVEVEQGDPLKTWLLVTGVSVGGAAAVMLITFAALGMF